MTATSHLSPLPTRVRRPGLLIGDAERDHACQLLAQHFAAGRLTADELDDRVSSAMSARTNVELHLLTADLPSPGEAAAGGDVANVATRPASVEGERVVRTMMTGLGVFVTVSAMVCTLLVLFGVAATSMGTLAWLASFGTAVSVAGLFHYGRLLRGQ